MFFDFILDFFRPVYIPPRPSKTCRECGRTYKYADQARICEDWDLVLGTERDRV